MSGIFVTYIVDISGCSSVALAFWRDTATAAALLTFSLLRSCLGISIRRNDIPWFVGMGGCLGFFHVFYNKSILLNGASVTTVEQAAMPAFVTLAAWYLWKEPINRKKLVSMAVIFLGTVMASGIDLRDLKSLNVAGLAVGLTVPVFYAGWTIAGKQVVGRYGAVFSLGIAFGIAALILLFFQPFAVQPSGLDIRVAFLFAGLIAVSTIGAFTLYMVGLTYIQASVASIVVMSEIMFAGIYARIFLDERLTPVQIAGALCVISGVIWLSSRRNNQA